jgi:hypothetical protein
MLARPLEGVEASGITRLARGETATKRSLLAAMPASTSPTVPSAAQGTDLSADRVEPTSLVITSDELPATQTTIAAQVRGTLVFLSLQSLQSAVLMFA